MSEQDRLARFLDFSAEVTGVTTFELNGTGQAQVYLETVERVLGVEILDELLDAYAPIGEAKREADVEQLLRRAIFSDEKFGPVARNIVKLWYAGVWYEMPPEWTDAFGRREHNYTFVVSPDSYREGLLWPAIGANPPGAKAPGYGSWALPPRVGAEPA